MKMPHLRISAPTLPAGRSPQMCRMGSNQMDSRMGRQRSTRKKINAFQLQMNFQPWVVQLPLPPGHTLRMGPMVSPPLKSCRHLHLAERTRQRTLGELPPISVSNRLRCVDLSTCAVFVRRLNPLIGTKTCSRS